MRAWVDSLPVQGSVPMPFDVRDALGAISVPSLVIVGEHDSLCAPCWSDLLHDGIPGSRLRILSGGGHMAYLEVPEAFARAVIEFVLQARY